jgi:hypothetical protein
MSNVISLDQKRKEKLGLTPDFEQSFESEQLLGKVLKKERLSFEELMTQNKKNQKRLKKERNEDNKNVMKSYRIK